MQWKTRELPGMPFNTTLPPIDSYLYHFIDSYL